MYPPPMQTHELIVTSSGEIDILEAPPTRRIAVYGFWAHQSVSVSASVTTEAKLFFGSDAITRHKRLASYEQDAAGEEFGIALSGLNVVGLIGEPVTLINAIYSVGSLRTDAILYYSIV